MENFSVFAATVGTRLLGGKRRFVFVRLYEP
jgi:hypothetical protein